MSAERIPRYLTTEVSHTYPAERCTRMPIQVEKKIPIHTE